ncbi:MAG TPA: phenylalanine--tRNA ligase subunit beta [Alphaproteobacteria bacterium]|nr:phenylalanine--tRNA ligase subunit beta [Alphaproteobacteria bacterium]
MKLTLAWLKDHLETGAALGEIAEKLIGLGLEVESIADRAKGLAPFTIAFVVEAKPHPNADRLRVCIVDTGRERVQVVCGAPNARTGMKGVFAPAGSHIPGTSLDLERGVIRGVESNGMLCSEREMGLSDEHSGIIELPADAPLGDSFARYLGLDDPVIDVAVTPNRGDCLGVRGIARDLAAVGLGRLKDDPRMAPVPGGFESPIKWRLALPEDAKSACPFVVGRFFRKVRNGTSPRWLQDRLRAIGLRPISALVDITNYVTFDLGRPLHVFDADKLAGDLTMRLARAGETLAALNGKSYTLDEAMTVIADEKGVAGLGGIVGGEASGCTEATRNVFLEVALFDPIRTAVTGRKLAIESDARYRFERGLDPTSAIWGAEVAAHLIGELCGGEASRAVSAGAMPEWRRTITLQQDRVLTLGGADMALAEQRRILEALGYEIEGPLTPPSPPEGGEGVNKVVPPPWRGDVTGEPDLIEDILRVYGYERIVAVPLPLEGALPRLALTASQRRARAVKRGLAARGLMEAVTWSFANSQHAGLFGGGNPALALANPISSDLDVMRPSILPNLIAAAGRNADRGFKDLALFEVGPQYADDTAKGQALVAAGVRAGLASPRHWAASAREVDAFDAKADALAAIAEAGGPAEPQVTTEAPAWYHPGRAGTLRLGANVLASFGVLHPKVLRRMDVKGPMVAFEVFLDRIPQPRAKAGKMRPLFKPSPFQPVERDFAFVVDAGVEAERLVRAAKGADKALISEVGVFDVYQGPNLPPGKKSLALSVRLQPVERTLTEEEIDAVGKRIVAAVAKATGGVLRS